MSKEKDYSGDYDGCSGSVSKFWRAYFGKRPPWEHCCDIHDGPYAVGGTAQERLACDIEMRKCVIKNGHPIAAHAMFHAIRIGGVPWLPTPWRWGFETGRYTYTKDGS